MAFTNFSILTKEMFFLLWLLIVIIIIYYFLLCHFHLILITETWCPSQAIFPTKELIRIGTHEAAESAPQHAYVIVVCIR